MNASALSRRGNCRHSCSVRRSKQPCCSLKIDGKEIMELTSIKDTPIVRHQVEDGLEVYASMSFVSDD